MQKERLLKKLGGRIRKIRNEKGLSQVELANSIGKDQQSVQRLESGNVNPSFFYLYEISEGLGIDVGDLLKKL
jgi:putative transcriptional regulator